MSLIDNDFYLYEVAEEELPPQIEDNNIAGNEEDSFSTSYSYKDSSDDVWDEDNEDKCYFLYGKLNREINKITYSGISTSTADTIITDIDDFNSTISVNVKYSPKDLDVAYIDPKTNELVFVARDGSIISRTLLSPFEQEQSDLGETDPDSETFVRGKKTSNLENDGPPGQDPSLPPDKYVTRSQLAEVTITAGDGLTKEKLSDIDTKLTLGTPSSITNTSTNSTTESSHTHKIDFTPVTSPTASGTSTSFIDTVSQGVDGSISATKKNLPEASTATKGIVQKATDNEITAGVNDTKFITPFQLKTVGDSKVTANQDIVGATHTKITYDNKGLVTEGSDLIIDDIPDLSTLYTPLSNTNRDVITAVAIPAAGGTVETPSDIVNLNITTTNINSGENTTVGTNLPLANENNAGLMSYNDKKNLSKLQERVSQLENSNVRLQYTDKADPTAAEIDSFVKEAGYSKPEGITVVVQATGHNWHYYENTGWQDDGVVGVSEFTNDTAGIIKGVTQDGKIYAEGNGVGSVYGWDNLKTTVNNKVTANQNITPATDFNLVKYDTKGLVITGKAPATLTVNGTNYDPKGSNVNITTLRKKSQIITGDGVTNIFNVEHSFGTNVTCQVFLKGQNDSDIVYELILVDILLLNNAVRIIFSQAPIENQEFKVIIIG